MKEARKQADDYKSQVAELEKKCKDLEQGQKDDKAEMISLELSDYKNSCAELKKQLENQKEAQKAKDELVKDLSQKNDKLMQEKAELEITLKDFKNEALKLQKEINGQFVLLCILLMYGFLEQKTKTNAINTRIYFPTLA